MRGELQDRLRGALDRARRLERREVRDLRVWLETTRNLVHVSVVLFVPLLIAGVTALANTVELLPFVLFPPLASGTYTLFADPEGRYASPVAFVGGLTAGALCGSAAVWFSVAFVPGAALTAETLHDVSPVAAALAVFLTGAVTWAFGVEEPAAFSTALLALVAPAFTSPASVSQFAFEYVASVLAASAFVAVAFHLWRGRFYERRARYLYRSTRGDDHVLVPMRGEHADASAMLGARLAAAHEAGKVVLFDVVDHDAVADEERSLVEERAANGAGATTGAASGDGGEALADEPDEAAVEPTDSGPDGDVDPPQSEAEERVASAAADHLEAQAARIETKVGVPCQVVVAADGDGDSTTVLQAAREANCDLVVTPYEEHDGRLSQFARDLLNSDTDVLIHRSTGGRTKWRRILVPVRSASDVAHAMLDFAGRLSGGSGRVGVCHCMGPTGNRRRAESMLVDLVETFEGNIETRVSRSRIEDFLRNAADQYDLVIMGASRDRSTASRFVSPPTFERIQELDADVAIMDRNG